MRIAHYIAVVVFVLISSYSLAGDTVIFNNTQQVLNISSKIKVLHDETTKLKIEDVMRSDGFRIISKDVPNLGISTSAHWGRFTIKNETQISRLLLEIEYPIIDEVEFYTIHKDSGHSVTKVGEYKPFSAREVDNQNYLFYLNIPHGESVTYYLRVKSGEQIQLPVFVGTAKSIYEGLIVKDLVFGVYTGIILVMIVYNLFVFFTVRDKNYLYYVMYIIFVGMTQVVLQGYGFKYLWPNSSWLTIQSTFLVPVFSGWTAIWFVQHFLHTKVNAPRAHRFLNWVFVFYTLCMVLSLFDRFYESQTLVQLTAMIGSLYTIGMAWQLSRKGYRPARFFFVAWSIFLISVCIFVLRNFNILPYNTYTYYALQIGSALEVTLLSFALADKINVYRKEKEDSQAEALRISLENERIIREQNTMLEVKVEERTHELNQSNKELAVTLHDLRQTQSQLVDAEKMASLGQLTAGIAHEINNPINFVSSNINPLKRDVDDILEIVHKYDELVETAGLKEQFSAVDKLKKELDFEYLKQEINVLLRGMDDGANRTVEIVKGLKSFSRLDESDLKFANINEGLESTLIILNSSLKGRVHVIKELGDIPEVECFAGKLNQVFMNIINNAGHAVMNNPDDREGEIRVKTYREGDHVVISIRDNGMGMDAETKEKIFQPFFTTKKAGEGTGLGLSITFSIIELHRGGIKVESELGKGTEFIISLPITQM
jgi:two-component system NtrC family sensor kinase